MKKKFIAITAMVAAMAVGGLVSANPANDGASVTYRINSDLTQVSNANMGSSNDNVEVQTLDSNPTDYTKTTVNGHTVESWMENGTAYTKLDGALVKSYKVNGDLEKKANVNMGSSTNNVEVTTVDHNPLDYQTESVGSHRIESWIQDGTVYTKVDGQTVKAYKINGDLETSANANMGSSMSNVEVDTIDHNPTDYTETKLAGHTAEGWLQDNTVYSQQKQ